MAAGSGCRSARVGASGHGGLREVERSGEEGEADSEGWSGGSNNASDAETEENGWGHIPKTAMPWGTQEIGTRGLTVDVLAGRSNGRKAPSATADKAETQGSRRAWHEQGTKEGGQRDREEA